VLAGLEELGIGYDDVVELLEVEGVRKFEDSYAQLSETVQGQLDAADD
jgi:transaldolase